jgi:hypothetical protein
MSVFLNQAHAGCLDLKEGLFGQWARAEVVAVSPPPPLQKSSSPFRYYMLLQIRTSVV